MFTASRLSSTIVALLALALAATIAAALPPSAAAAAQWQSSQTDGDRCWDASTLDADFNGYAEQIWFDLDNDCRWDTHQYNTRYADNFHEEVSYDMDENGVPEYVIQDIDQRVGFEWAYIDLNQDRRFETKRVIPGSSLDQINRANNRTMKVITASQMFHFATMTGQSLLYPTFRTP
jgi:hypothetical protein